VPDARPVFEIGLVLLAAAIAGAASRRAGLPAVLGYLIVGLLIGPFTPGYVADRHQIQVLADVGVVLLLFEVGIELDLRALRREPRSIVVAVPAQIAACVVVAVAALAMGGLPWQLGATVGLAVALSSSVVVVNMTRSRRRTLDDATARALLVWAVLQDAVSVVAVPALAIALSSDPTRLPLAVAKLAAFVAFAFVVHVLIAPILLRRVQPQPDTFLVVAVSIALVTAGVGALAFDVPVALAAFVAGLALSLREEAREARREILPFRDLFAVLFFVAVGSLVDPGLLPPNLAWFALALALVIVKGGLSAALAALASVPARPLQLGVGLAQVGEFSFVVLGLGVAANVVTQGQFSAVLAAAALSIAVSTVLVRVVRT
jgi:CPA2 family monovalent cation:H+ antiporter-2